MRVDELTPRGLHSSADMLLARGLAVLPDEAPFDSRDHPAPSYSTGGQLGNTPGIGFVLQNGSLAGSVSSSGLRDLA
jgi:hypothetical protein